MRSWEENVRKVVPYVPGEQPRRPGMIKLNTNENPYPPSPLVAQTLAQMNTEELRLYPDATASDLTNAIAEMYGLSSDQVFVGVGSDDVLAMIFLTFFNSEKPIVFPDITYSFYDVWADMLRIPYRQIPLDADLKIAPADYGCGDGSLSLPGQGTKRGGRTASDEGNGGVIFPNPNAPTGELMPIGLVEAIVAANPNVIVVVDEAYIDFGGESALPLIRKYDNVIVVQTFSKSRSMAGSRIGYAMGSPLLIKYLNDVKYSFNSYTMDRITVALGEAAVRDRAYFEETVGKIIRTREWTKEQLRNLGFIFGDSMSNFLFVTHPKVQAERLFEDLRAKDIYVRHFKRPERISNYLRITIGTDEQMEQVVDFLREYLQTAES